MRWRGRARAERAGGARDRIVLAATPGLALCGTGAVLAAIGLAVVGPPLAVPGFALLALGGLCLASVAINLLSVRASGRLLTRTTLTEGDALRLAMDVRVPWLPGLGTAALEHPLLDEPRILTRETPASIVVNTRLPRRGRVRLSPPTVLISDPLGLVHGVRRCGVDLGELLVLPRTEPVRWLTGDGAGAAAPAAADWNAPAGAEATDLAGLRDYQAGTPATRIHWPALARGGTLLERVFENEDDTTPLLVLDPRVHDPVSGPTALDSLIRGVASLLVELNRSGPVELALPGASGLLRMGHGSASWPAVRQALALLEAAPASTRPPTAAALGLLERERDGLLIYAATAQDLAAAGLTRWRRLGSGRSQRALALVPREAAERASAPGAAPAWEAAHDASAPGAVGLVRDATEVLEVAGCVALGWGQKAWR